MKALKYAAAFLALLVAGLAQSGGAGAIAISQPPPSSGPGSGDVVGPASAVNNEVAVFSGTTGKIIKVADGPITVTAGGTNQNITLTPSGTGITAVSNTGIQLGQNTTATIIGNSSGRVAITSASGQNISLTPGGSGVISVGGTAGSLRALSSSGVFGEVYAGGSTQLGTRIGVSRVLNFDDGLVSYNLTGVSGADTYQTNATFTYAGLEFYFDGSNRRGVRLITSNAAQTAATPFTPSYPWTINGDGKITHTPAAFSTSAWGVTGAIEAKGAVTITDSTSSGTVATAVANSFAVPTFAASSATTFTNAANLYIAGDVAAGTNVTLTNSYGLWNGGKTRLDGAVVLPSTNTAGLQLYNTADQTTNYERLEVIWSSNTAIIRNVKGGSGTVRALQIGDINQFVGQMVFRGGSSSGSVQATSASSSGATKNFVFTGGNQTATSGSTVGFELTSTYNQASGTAANTDLLINRTQTAVGSGAQLLIDAQVGSVSQWNVSNGGAVTQSVQALSGAGAINITQAHTDFTSTGGAQALTLANGTVGQTKTIVHVVDGGSGVLTPTTRAGYASITFTNAGDSVTLRYSSTGWAVVGVYGATVTP